MPETRVVARTFENGVEIETITQEISDEELAEEAEQKEIRLIIEKLSNTGINKVWKRLLKKGYLP